MRALSAFERSEILRRAADATESAVEELARTIALEVGKPLVEAAARRRGSPRSCAQAPPRARACTARRCRSTRRRTAPASSAFTIRQPCGVVVAISPFNYPALLVAHKVGPALAAGNAVVLKPARQTPLTALLLTRILLEAGLPEKRSSA